MKSGRLKRQSQRIVSLAPSATSILCEIGAKPLLVGVSKWCADVAPVKHLPKFGDCWRLDSVETILHLRPTLVIGSVPFQADTVAKLLEHPLRFLAINPRSLSDVYNDIRLLARITRLEQNGKRLVLRMRNQFRQLRVKSSRKRSPFRPRVYSEAWPNPRISSPPWVAQLIGFCGGQMTVPAGKRVSDADVASAGPEIIVLAWAATGAKSDPRKAYSVAAWKEVPAIQTRRVHVVPDELLNTPGPPLMEGARQLFELIHSNARGAH
jgi:iron complex transport system substrate-binding protein